MDIKELISNLASTLPISYAEDNFYDYVVNTFNSYIEELNVLSDADVNAMLKSVGDIGMDSPHTKKRFLNLINFIQRECLIILQYAYKGDILEASSLLLKLMTLKKSTQYKLCEPYFNYFLVSIESPNKLYRCRVEKNKVEDCWHLPFEKRYLSSNSRFNLSGYPCMYLADSINCASYELGKTLKEKKRWVQTFVPTKKLYFLNLAKPSDNEFENMSEYDEFSFLLTYPIKQLCLAKTKNEGKFHEEYLFSQLLLHTLFIHRNDMFINDIVGICYSSTEINGKNYVIPAKYSEMVPQFTGHSQNILILLKPLGEPKSVVVNAIPISN